MCIVKRTIETNVRVSDLNSLIHSVFTICDQTQPETYRREALTRI